MAALKTFAEVYEDSTNRNIEDGLMDYILNEEMKNFSNEERVKSAYSMLKQQFLMPPITIKEKSGETSLSFRNLGNDKLRENKLYEAMQLYNLALLHAPIGSPLMAVAFGNRSAVLCLLKHYKDSLKDIEIVLGMDLEHPEDLLSKLLRRQKLCRKALSGQKHNKDINTVKKEYWNKSIHIKYPHDTIPCASSSVEIRSTPEMGRHVVATKDIQVGEVVAVEKPYAALLLKSQYLIRCYHCLAICNNLLPCNHCCYVMFCSSTCREAAWTEYHVVECPLMPTLVEMDFAMKLHALRILIKARLECSSWTIFMDKIKLIESSLDTKYRGHVLTDDGKYILDSKYFHSIHSLKSNVDKRSNEDLYQKSQASALFLHFLDTKTSFFELGDDEDWQKMSIFWKTGGILLQHLMITGTNTFGFHPLAETESGSHMDDVKMGIGSYAFLSLFNHSCIENVQRMYQGTETAMIAIRPVKKGQQLFYGYGFGYETNAVEKRRKDIQVYFQFTCDCIACKDQWPLMENLRLTTKLSDAQKRILYQHRNDAPIFECLNRGDTETALRHYPDLCKVAEAFDNTYPSLPVCLYKEMIRRCMYLLSDTVPLGYTRLYKWY